MSEGAAPVLPNVGLFVAYVPHYRKTTTFWPEKKKGGIITIEDIGRTIWHREVTSTVSGV